MVAPLCVKMVYAEIGSAISINVVQWGAKRMYKSCSVRICCQLEMAGVVIENVYSRHLSSLFRDLNCV